MSDAGWRIAPADLGDPQVIALLDLHLRSAHANSPPGSVFALDLSGLRDPTVAVWAAWEDATLLGLGAIKRLGDGHAELKSMRTAPDHLRRGVGAAMLDHLIAEARGSGITRLSLETGSHPAFAPAHALYARAGFVACPPFGRYEDTVFARYLTREI
ncbi:GNAT family N-acetyltransferase [Sphingomonas ginsenosidivorax]|uniref:GNAT family N-acetyltransferase n=1 Tax=Sphingomonas ginsenosidivorax TaxID=862135 RepID=UPI001F55861C|nr:GNAT family N-acetyltransferase [Sphingomonas ginsenosidivorax]